MQLENLTAVITGGNSGIGFGVAQAFAREGAGGAILGRNLETLAEAERALGGRFVSRRCDVTRTSELELTFRKLRSEIGEADILVVNAGGAIGPGTLGSIDEVGEKQFDAMMALNLKSVFFTVQKALPMLKDDSSIILVSSIAAHRAFPGMAVYSAAKAGVRALARNLSLDLRHRKIRVNVLSPGTVRTPVFERMGLDENAADAVLEHFSDIIPAGRTGVPEDMGHAAVYLASRASSFLLGSELIADGGVLSQ